MALPSLAVPPLPSLPPAAGSAGALSGPDLTRYALVCVALVLAIAAVGWGLRRVLASSVGGRSRRRSIRVVDVLSLGGRKRLCVVRCYDRCFVIGLGDRELTLVGELEGDAVEAPRAEPAAPRDPRAFAALLASSRRPPAREPSPEPEPAGLREGVLG